MSPIRFHRLTAPASSSAQSTPPLSQGLLGKARGPAALLDAPAQGIGFLHGFALLYGVMVEKTAGIRNHPAVSFCQPPVAGLFS